MLQLLASDTCPTPETTVVLNPTIELIARDQSSQSRFSAIVADRTEIVLTTARFTLRGRSINRRLVFALDEENEDLVKS